MADHAEIGVATLCVAATIGCKEKPHPHLDTVAWRGSTSKADRPATGAGDERRRVALETRRKFSWFEQFLFDDFWRSVRKERAGDEEMARKDATSRSTARSRCATSRKSIGCLIARYSGDVERKKSGCRLDAWKQRNRSGLGRRNGEEWALAHQALSKLRLKRAALDADEGTWLLRAFRAATHVYFGYASFAEYIERLFGLRRRATEEKLRVAPALEALPELAEALRSGKLNWSVVRELTRVAVPETEREWLLSVCRKTAREVERMVSGLAPGDRPADRRRPEYLRHILRFEVGAETLATFPKR